MDHRRRCISFRQMFHSLHGRCCGVLAGLLILSAASLEAQPSVRQVLLLHSLDRGNMTLDYWTSNFRVELDRRAGQAVNVVQVVVSPQGFIGAPEQAVVDYVRSAYAGRTKPDLIVAMAGPAAVFARTHRGQLFPETPLLFAGADERYLRNVPLERERGCRPSSERLSGLSSTLSSSCCPRPGNCLW